MWKYLVLSAMALSGCQSTGSGTITSLNVAADILTFEQQVTADTVALCGVEPVAADIAALFSSAAGIAQDANGICAAVNGAGSAKVSIADYRDFTALAPAVPVVVIVVDGKKHKVHYHHRKQ